MTKEEFVEWYNVQKKKCVYCKVEERYLKQLNGPLYKRASRLTIDCVDNDTGYCIDNIVLACDRCNVIKSNVFTHHEMLEIGEKYLKPKWMNELKGEEND